MCISFKSMHFIIQRRLTFRHKNSRCSPLLRAKRFQMTKLKHTDDRIYQIRTHTNVHTKSEMVLSILHLTYVSCAHFIKWRLRAVILFSICFGSHCFTYQFVCFGCLLYARLFYCLLNTVEPYRRLIIIVVMLVCKSCS